MTASGTSPARAESNAVSTVAIRDAAESDLPRIVEMTQAFIRETAWGERVADNPEHFTAAARRVMDEGRMFLAEAEDGNVVGMLAGYVFFHPVTGQRIGAELIWWVDPDARGSGAGRTLFEAAETWAREEGATAMQFSAYRDERLEELYRRLGYAPYEVVFQKELQQ